MTTVGYGDIYPSTTPGRIVSLGAIIVGAFLIGLVINIIAVIFELKDRKKECLIRILTESKAIHTISLALKFNLQRQRYRRRVFLHFEDGDYIPSLDELCKSREAMVESAKRFGDHYRS